MKVQCDVCGAGEATVFCCADEAALCGPCDAQIHRANKLAGRHRRLSLLPPSSPPLCDVCQEKRGLLFCQQDRAILCRDCDASIHSANHLTMKHTRFLLTGIRLSPAAAPSPSTAAASQPESVADAANHRSNNFSSNHKKAKAKAKNGGDGSNSISEYLIEMLPGWHVEDLLFEDAAAANSTAAASCGSYQMDESLPFPESSNSSSCGGWFGASPAAAAEDLPVWVPHLSDGLMMGGSQGCLLNQGVEERLGGSKTRRQGQGEDGFPMVPQLHSSKRSKLSFW